jgi:hypothetical protein
MHSIQDFRVVFEYGIRYYPKKKGICLLFQKNTVARTPFQSACSRHGRDKVKNVIEDTLLDCQRRRRRRRPKEDEDEDDSNTSGPYN